MANNNIKVKVDVDHTELSSLSVATDNAKQGLQRLGSTSDGVGDSVRRVGKKANRTGVLAQQAGYQFGDFAVQVQSGTSPLIAFSQQATQLIGTFSMLATSTKAIMAFSALGVIVPVVSALAGAFVRASGSAKSFKVELEETKKVVEEYISLKSSMSGFGAEGFSAAEEALKGTSSAYKDLIALAKLDVLDGITKSIDALGVSALNTNWILGEIGEIGNLLETETQLQGNITVFKENRKQAALFRQQLVSLGEASGLNDQYKAAVELRDSFTQIVGPMDDMNEEQRTFYEGLLQTIFQMELLGAATKNTGNHYKNFLKAHSDLQNEIGLLRVQEQNGAGSAQAKQAELANELRLREEAIDKQVASNKITSSQALQLKKQLRVASALGRQIEINTRLEENRLASIQVYYDYQAKIAQQQADRKAAVDAIAKSTAEEETRLNNQIALYEKIRDYGENSVEVAAERARQARDAYENTRRQIVGSGNLLKAEMALYDSKVLVKEEAEQAAAAQKVLSSAAQSFSNLWDNIKSRVTETTNAMSAVQDRLREEIAGRKETLELLQIENAEGKDSVAYRDALVNVERLRLQALYSQYAESAKLVDEAVELYEAILDAEGATKASAAAAERFARALKDAALAGQTLASLKFEFSAGGRAMSLYAGRGTVVDRKMEGDLPEGYYDKPSGGGGSKTDPAEEFAKYLEGLKQQAEIEGRLVGLFGEKREIEKAVLEARNKYGPAFADQQESELRATLQLIDAEKERQRVLEEAQAAQQSIADTLQSSMSDAFMSMVEGTKSFKDAMKGMARAVIKQLYDVLVVQRLVGSFNSKDPNSSTGIMGFLGGILGRASGGTVMSNQPYLVGEKGPELIVPHNRGHVMNADLTSNAMGGSGGSVVVNQSFNFSANGDDSVKRIIAQAAPSIANMAKQSVMDARRRGGSMKNTFG